jgi:hypothetical protein
VPLFYSPEFFWSNFEECKQVFYSFCNREDIASTQTIVPFVIPRTRTEIGDIKVNSSYFHVDIDDSVFKYLRLNLVEYSGGYISIAVQFVYLILLKETISDSDGIISGKY